MQNPTNLKTIIQRLEALKLRLAKLNELQDLQAQNQKMIESLKKELSK
jgi:hypothetical protein